MKKARIKETKKNRQQKDESLAQESVSVKSVVITLVVILVTFGAFYFLTDFLISKRTIKTVEASNTNTNTNEIAFLDILRQDNEEYYVFALTDTKDEAIYQRYAIYAKKTYYIVDMNDIMNKTYMGEKTSVGDKVKDIRISDTTLFVIKDGKISEHFTGYEDITGYLKEKLDVSSNINKK